MRTILEDVDRVMSSKWYSAWALMHGADDQKIKLERQGSRRPLSQDSWARTFIEAIRVGLEWETPPPPPLSLAELGRNVMFTAQNPIVALRCPAHWKIAVSGDPAYDTAVRAAAPDIKKYGHLLAVWGEPTHAARMRQLSVDLKADFGPIFQAENQIEYAASVAAGARMLVGNPNGWTDEQRADAMGRGDTMTTMFEVYSNAGSPWPDTASSRGVPISCEVLGVGQWGSFPDMQLADYRPHTPDGVWATISVYYAEGMSEESWGLLP